MLSNGMMRRLAAAGAAMALLGAGRAATAAPAAEKAAAAGNRIGYFDVKRILSEVDEAKAAKARLESDFKQKQKQLDEQKAEIEKAQNDLQQKQAVMSQSAKEQAQGELLAKMQNAQKLYMDLQQELAQKEQQALGDLIQKLEPVVREIAEEEGFTYVFEKNEAGLFYAPAGDDLTAQLIRKYNLRYPPKGGAAPAGNTAQKAGGKK